MVELPLTVEFDINIDLKLTIGHFFAYYFHFLNERYVVRTVNVVEVENRIVWSRIIEVIVMLGHQHLAVDSVVPNQLLV